MYKNIFVFSIKILLQSLFHVHYRSAAHTCYHFTSISNNFVSLRNRFKKIYILFSWNTSNETFIWFLENQLLFKLASFEFGTLSNSSTDIAVTFFHLIFILYMICGKGILYRYLRILNGLIKINRLGFRSVLVYIYQIVWSLLFFYISSIYLACIHHPANLKIQTSSSTKLAR